MNETRARGRWGEDEAVRFLEKKGLKLVERSFQTRWGEIDAIFREGDTWVFVEVKTRGRASDFPAVEAVSAAKQKRLTNAALMYMKRHRLEDCDLRFDVVIFEGDQVDWIRSAFDGSSRYSY